MQPLRLLCLARNGVIACIALLGIVGCNDEPSPVGSDYLPETVRFSTYVVQSGEIEIVSGQAATSNSTSRGASSILVGQSSDGTVAHGLLAITDPIKALEGSTPREVTAVSLRLRTLPYRFGDLGDRQASFDVVAIDESALDTMRYSDAIAAKIAAAPSLGTYSGVLPDSANVTITLDLAAARTFLREYYEYDTTVTTVNNVADTVIALVTKKTIALRARSNARVVATFLGATVLEVPDTLRPKLIVAMGDSTAMLSVGVTSCIADVPVATGPNRIVVAGGEPIRTFFQVKPAGLPAGATIHQARLTLRVDTTGSKHGSTGPTTYVVLLDADGSAITSLLGRSLGRLMHGYRKAANETTFTDLFEFNAVAPSITAAVRSRRAGGAAVAPFVLALGRGSGSRPDQETSTVDRIVFHGMDAADSSLRPNLTIIYSTQTDAP